MRPLRHKPKLRRFLLVTVCGLSVACAARAIKMPLKPGGRNAEIHKQIETMEAAWHDAILSGDGAAVGAFLADSYVGIGPDGTIQSRAEEVKARADGQERLEKLDTEERKIRVFGSTAVVTSRVDVEGNYSGRPITGQYRYTRVWSLAHGQWQIVSFEASRVNDPSARRP